MSEPLKADELAILKTIAETLNQSNDLHAMLDTSLRKLLELTRLHTGWIFLTGDKPDFVHAADQGLPPALAREHKKPMCEGSCWCLDEYWEGDLKRAVNIIHCKRLDDARKQGHGDTCGITHHATIPLLAGEQRLGLLNVAAPGKRKFSEAELSLLQAVAYQIGTAVNRTRLFRSEQRRADSYAKLGQASGQINRIMESDRIPEEAVRLAHETWGWPVIAYVDESMIIRALFMNGQVHKRWLRVDGQELLWARDALDRNETRTVRLPEPASSGFVPPYRSGVAAPLTLGGEPMGVLMVCSPDPHAFDAVDAEVLQAFAGHVALASENARLFEQRRDLARWEERNRLARDLHDSVSQTLFSMALTAKGVEQRLPEVSESVGEAIREISRLAQHASKEMRALITQLRPAELEDGLAAALEKYGRAMGLTVQTDIRGNMRLSRKVEETLLRIGQEALNNVRKHAGVNKAEIALQADRHQVTMRVADRGSGCSNDDAPLVLSDPPSFGLRIMTERAELLNGTVTVESIPGQGTTVHVHIPLGKDGNLL